MNARCSEDKPPINDLLRQIAGLKGQLNRVQAEMNALIDLLPMSACIALDTGGKRMYTNKVLEELLGTWHKSDEAKSTSPWDQPYLKFYGNGRELRPEDLPIRSALATGKPVHKTEFDVVRADGMHVNFSGDAVPLFDEEGQVRGAIGVFDDITERKKIEESLRKLSMAVEQSPESIVITDVKGNIEYVNPKFTEITGYTLGEALGQNPRLLKSGETPESVYKELWETILSGRDWRGEFINKKKNGEYYCESASISPVKDDRGQITHFVAVKLDITERKRTEGLIRVRMRLMEFAATHSLEEILQETLDEIGEITYSPIGFYHFIEADQRTLSLQAWSTRTLREFCTASGKGFHYPIDKAGVWVDCVHQRRPVIHNDYASLPHRRGMPEGHAHVIRELVVPILRGDRIVAILGVGNKPFDYNDKDVESVAYLADVAWEIAERKRAEEALQLSEERFRVAISSSPISVFSQDQDLRYTWAFNPASGFKTGRIVGKTDADLLPPVDAGRILLVKRGVIESGLGQRIVSCVHWPDGDFWYDLTAEPLRNDAGAIVGLTCAIIDITDRKNIEEDLRRARDEMEQRVEERTAELKDSEERLRLAQQVARIGTFEWNIQTCADRDMLEMRADNGLPQDSFGSDFEAWVQMIHPEDRARTVNMVQDALEEGYFETEFRVIFPDGSLHWLNARGQVFKDASGMPVRMIGVNIDVTERKHAVDALAAAKAEADLYVDLMGHDINNLNQISRGFLELGLQKIELEGKLTADDIFLVDKAIEAIDNSSRLIHNVRMLQNEKLGLYTFEVLDLGKTLGDAAAQTRQVPGRDVTINYTAARGCYVLANQLLKDVFINLIGNAIKHSTGPLIINLEVNRESDGGRNYWKVIVEDNGPGIPDIRKNTLFDRYNIPAIRAGGKGFGLYLIKTLVDDYKGEFRVEDRVPGDHTKGARFVVMLPAVE